MKAGIAVWVVMGGLAVSAAACPQPSSQGLVAIPDHEVIYAGWVNSDMLTLREVCYASFEECYGQPRDADSIPIPAEDGPWTMSVLGKNGEYLDCSDEMDCHAVWAASGQSSGSASGGSNEGGVSNSGDAGHNH